MDSMNVSTTLSPEQQICLDRLLAEGGIRKKRKLPLPLKVKGELKKDGKDESTTTISERLWEDEWHRDSGQCQQAVEAASSSKGDGQQPHEETEGMSKQLDKSDMHQKGKTPKGIKTTPKGVKSMRWEPNPENPRELELRKAKDAKIKREIARKQRLGLYTTPKK